MKTEKFLNLISETMPIYLLMGLAKSLEDNNLSVSNFTSPTVLGATAAFGALVAVSQPVLAHFEKHGAKDLYGYIKNRRAEKAEAKKMKM